MSPETDGEYTMRRRHRRTAAQVATPSSAPTRPVLSILTPTYNRAEVLCRPYESLLRQSRRDFEWVVVDDGSTDGSASLVRRWQADAPFPITLLTYRNNRGRNAAINSGLELVSGEYTLFLDSDDELLDHALESVALWQRRSGIDADPQVHELLFRCVDRWDRPLGKEELAWRRRGADSLRASRAEAYYSLGIRQEMISLAKTSAFRVRRYVELSDSEHCPPSVTHFRLSEQYQSVFVNCAIRRYWRGDGIERLTDRNPRIVQRPRGQYLRERERLNRDLGFLASDPRLFLRAGSRMVRFGLHVGRPLRRQFADLHGILGRLLWLLALPRGCVGFLKDRWRGKRARRASSELAAWGPAADPVASVLNRPPGHSGTGCGEAGKGFGQAGGS